MWRYRHCMLFNHTGNTKHPVRHVDRRDPDYVDVDQEEVLDKKVDHTEEVWRERQIDNEQNRNHQ